MASAATVAIKNVLVIDLILAMVQISSTRVSQKPPDYNVNEPATGAANEAVQPVGAPLQRAFVEGFELSRGRAGGRSFC